MNESRSIQDKVSDIGILGGSFDPVHSGHLALAQLALEHFTIEKVLFVPANIQPHKKTGSVESNDNRLEMLRLALKDNPGFEIWDGEIKRGGRSYTVDTLRELYSLNNSRKVFFLIGSDNIREMVSWKDYDWICRMSVVCAAERLGYETSVPAELEGYDIRFFPGPENGVSSSLIRERIAQGYSCRYMIPESVYKFISDKGLYSAG